MQHSARSWECVCWGHDMAARRSLTVTLPFIPLGPHCPDQARQPAPAAQLAVLLPAEVTDNQPAMMHICVSCENCVHDSHIFFLHKNKQPRTLKKSVVSSYGKGELCQIRQLSSVCKGLTRVCSKSQFLNFWVKMISAKQSHAPKLGGFLRGRTQLLFACK